MISRPLRIGMVCPYGWDVPGGVQMHIRELAEHFTQLGHYVSVISPVSDEESITDPWLVNAGRPVPIPFNGSVARVLFGPIAASRVRQWIAQGDFDILHMHEPGIPSISLLACWAAEGAMVGTFHASTPKMRAIASVGPLIEPMIEKLSARIAVSEMAQATLNNLYGTEAVVIPNGIDYSRFNAAGRSRVREEDAPLRIGFLGRFEETRKGLPLLLEALPKILKALPNLELVVAGPGDPEKIVAKIDPQVSKHIRFLGRLSESEKVEFLSSLDLYIAPNTGGESFGIILAEAMASGTPVLASNIQAFVDLLAEGDSGVNFVSEDANDLAKSVIELLRNSSRLLQLSQNGLVSAVRFDWSSVASQIMSVYEVAMTGQGKVAVGSENASYKKGR
ncbi:MAG: glycosyltransferase family 4 protein [Actinomycetes bacterium]